MKSVNKKINKLYSKIFSNKLIKWIVVPFLLLSFWFLSTFIYGSYKNFSVLEYSHTQKITNHTFKDRILMGKKLSVNFKAKEDNLGIIAVRFKKVPVVDSSNEDILIFRIKEEGSDTWLYANKYKSGQIKSYSYFPFGFEIMKNSNGKNYIYEIYSLAGNESNAVQINDKKVEFISKYKFSQDQILVNSHTKLKFLSERIYAVFTNSYILITSSFFLLPFFFYLIFIVIVQENTFSKKLKINEHAPIIMRYVPDEFYLKKKNMITFLCLFLIFIYIFLTEVFVTGIVLGLLGFWLIVVYVNKINSGITYFLSFSIIFLSLFGIYLNLGISVDQASSFAYMLLLVGLFQDLFNRGNIYLKIRKISRKFKYNKSP